MKKVLVTGVNSYVGNRFAEWVEQYPDDYDVDRISVRDDKWKDIDLSIYDTILHVAGIAHVSTDPNMEELYYKVNRDLTIELAEKAKASGVKQFIFMSSIIVYGDSKKEKIVIDEHTETNPSNFYGRSKLEAEKGIQPLEGDNFKIAIIRPPMIYGKGSKGNYPKLAKAAQKLPIFPDIDNERSMLHVDNLSEFLRLIIKNEDSGIYFPQNKEYVKTSEMVSVIAEVHNKKVRPIKFFNPILKILINKVNIVNKLFGNLIYDTEMSVYKEEYNLKNFNESILATEEVIRSIKKKKYNNKIDVLLLSDNGLDTVGGEQESTKIIINGIKEKFSLGVIQPGEIKKPQLGVHYYPLTTETRIKHLIKKPVVFIQYIWNVKKIIRHEKPKIIHTQAQVSFFIVSLLMKLKLISKDIKLIHTERGLYTKYNKLIKRIFFFFMKELDVLITTTQFNMNYWKKAIESKSLLIEYNIIENTAGELFEVYNPELERKDDNKLVIGFAGRYADWKNWPLAVEISEKLYQELGDKLIVHMAVGCLDEQSEIDTRKMFYEMSNRLGNSFKGQINISLEEMDKFYYELDVFILTSNYNTESFGRTLVEAMSRKVVVLTTDAGGTKEVVNNSALIFKDAIQFKNKIIEFYKTPKYLLTEKKRNFKDVRRRYSLENNITKHLKLYSESKR